MVPSRKYIPSEILIDNILPRLPVETLIRFTSVCKSWYVLVRNPNFISSRLNHSISRAETTASGCLLVMPSALTDDSKIMCSVLCDNTFSVFEMFVFDFWFEVRTVIANMGICCNGVICLTEASELVRKNIFLCNPSGENIFLCNPSIRKVKKLRSSEMAARIHNCGLDVDHAMGFGFDEATNDYKVVRVYYIINYEQSEFEIEAELYSLRIDQWKRIEEIEWIVEGKSWPTDGAIHWLARKFITAFDFHDEAFSKMELPEERDDADEIYLSLYKGLLALLVISAAEDRDRRAHIDIWVMKVYDMTNSWTKQFSGVIDVDGASFEQCRFTKNGKLIFEREGNMLASWDPEMIQIVDLGFKKHQHKIVDEFVERLILLEDGT